jgi:ribosome maturation factor RimP
VIASERIVELVEPVLAGSGHTLYDVEVAGATVRLLVEGADLGELEHLSRAASAVLDDVVDDDERWYLEVSSPGLERPLRAPRHFAGAVGSQVSVKTTPTTEGDRRIEGVLEAADGAGVVVAGRRLTYDQIERARTVFEWGPSGRGPGGASSRSPRAQPSRRREPSEKRSTT